MINGPTVFTPGKNQELEELFDKLYKKVFYSENPVTLGDVSARLTGRDVTCLEVVISIHGFGDALLAKNENGIITVWCYQIFLIATLKELMDGKTLISTTTCGKTKTPPIKALIENPGTFAYSPNIGRGLTDEELVKSMEELHRLSPEDFMLRAAASAKELELMYPNDVKIIGITVPNPKTFKHYPKDNK